MENKKQTPYMCKVEDLILVKNLQSTKFGQNAYDSPWTITEVRNNRTIKIKMALSQISTTYVISCHIQKECINTNCKSWGSMQ